MITLSFRVLPASVVEVIFYIVEALDLDLDGQAIVYDPSSGAIQLEGKSPRCRTTDVIQPPRRYRTYQLPDEAARFLLSRCSQSGVSFVASSTP